MKCEKCGSTIILKYTSHLNGVLSKYWKCPVCGASYEASQKNSSGEVILK
ncbi:MAG: hypothetical protein K6A34_06295 [Methanobrevibacter sp.]|nr:hypothetical protein [Methanobrevibacter sp.]